VSARFGDAEVADLIETIVYLDEARACALPKLRARVNQCEPDVERIDYAHRLLMARQRLLGDAYPFLITPTAVGRRERSRSPSCYIDLLAMSAETPMRKASRCVLSRSSDFSARIPGRFASRGRRTAAARQSFLLP